MAALPSGRELLVLAACVTVVVILLWIPVAGDRMTAAISAKAPKAAPRIFLLGLVLLVSGILASAGVLVAIGGCLIGILVLGVLLDNY